MRRIVAALLLIACATATSQARTLADVERVCPIDDQHFTAKVDTSGTMFCRRLDMKPIGAIGAPPEVPVCPKDGFIVYKDGFSSAEIEKLKPWVQSDEYKKLAANESTYYRLAAIRERLGDAPIEVGFAYVAASWQVEADAAKYKRYLEKALPLLEAAASASGQDEQGRVDATLLAIEVERHLGRFESAGKRLEAFSQTPPAAEETIQLVVTTQRDLIAKKDSGPHYLTAKGDSEEKCRAWEKNPPPEDEPEDAEVPPRAEIPVEAPPPTPK